MALAQVNGLVTRGVSGVVVRVEVDVANGLPSVGVVGLPDTSVSEARWRVRSAISSIGGTWPDRRITISLSPAEVRKQGAGLDLPIAVGILAASEQLPPHHLGSTCVLGELGLDGRLVATRGTLAGALAARAAGHVAVVIPETALREVARLTGIAVVGAGHLSDVVRLLSDDALPAVSTQPPLTDLPSAGVCAVVQAVAGEGDLADVRGHPLGRLAVEVAAAGGHHLAFVGAPGVGKTMLAERLVGLLPDLGDDEALDVAALYSVAGLPRPDARYSRPPLRAPHHSASSAAILGSVRGTRVTPGAATLAHRGVLFLDEAPEFARPALEGLRQPLESGFVTVDRAGWTGPLPARFQLVLAANPCPCGLRIGTGAGCSCAPAAVRRYAARLSGPLLDRVDIRVPLQRPTDAELADRQPGESTAAVRSRVCEARERSRARLRGTPWSITAEVPPAHLRRCWPLAADAADLLADLERRSANLRGPDRVLRLSWTLADLGGRARPGADDVALAMSLRGASIGWSA